MAGYYEVTITAGGKVVLLKQDASDSKGAGTSNADVITAKAWIHITAGQSGNAALSWAITDTETAADGFTALGTDTDSGMLVGQFAVRPVDAENGDDSYYNTSGVPVGSTANDITVSWPGISA